MVLASATTKEASLLALPAQPLPSLAALGFAEAEALALPLPCGMSGAATLLADFQRRLQRGPTPDEQKRLVKHGLLDRAPDSGSDPVWTA